MAGASMKKPPDLALLLAEPMGKGGSKPPKSDPMVYGDDEEDSEPMDDEDELPPGFVAAVEEYEAAEGADERAKALYRAFRLCK